MKLNHTISLALAMALLTTGGVMAAMTPQQKGVLDAYLAQSRAAEPAFEASAARGEAFFQGKHAGGKPDSPSCTSCHTSNLKSTGKTRAGKDIEPMAPSVNPKRFSDAADVEKWLKRNCTDVLGRECTAKEKSDVLAYLLTL